MRNTILFGTAVVSVLAAACGDASDPGTRGGRGGWTPDQPQSYGVDEAPETDAAASSAESRGDAAVTTAPDASMPAGLFGDAGAYAAKLGGNTEKGDHESMLGNRDPAKADCLRCHKSGGDGPRFELGGTIYRDKGATMPVQQAEVRVVDASGAVFTTFSGQHGNFYIKGGDPIVFPARVAIRDGKSDKQMSATISSGDCNSSGCHGGSQGWILLP